MQNGEQSEMIRSLDKLVKCVGVAIIPIGIILVAQSLVFQNASFHSSVTSMVAAVIGMIPEGLYLLASVALAVSSIRLAQQKVLLHDMKCIETLARVDVLCVDKTGTITENTMKVQELIPTEQYDTEKMGSLRLMVGDFVSAMAKETFQYFAEQGVEVKVISGDNPVTVSKVAKTAGIKNAENYVDASSLETEEDIKKAILEKTVFGRVTPNQKRQFVQALKEAGKTVAMTGDGVNDVLALKDADCSIAMASGSEAAAQASQIVLLESDFSCMPQVVLEGRRVVNNIQRSASLFLVKNIFSFLLSLFSVVFMFTYPLEPSQVSLISMFTIGIPAFFLALEPNKNIIKGHFLTNVFLKALPAALTDALAVGALVVFGKTFGVGEQDISTAATMLLAIVGFMILYKISAPMNKLRAGILGGCIAGLLFCSIYLNQLFAISGMTTKCIMLFVVFAIATEPVLRYLTILLGKGRFYYRRLRGKTPLEEEA